ncbi:hypothetical protein RDI86_02095 [Cellulosimicrobium sp. XJ-DQ-B-000]|nr:hypothetical protein [Cellulosimicrobium sp. XJ-DQ-B-000]MDQ8040639.1 hypothetical protein [Cellulosimicrobium sp. XJ-DQ-B-000]
MDALLIEPDPTWTVWIYPGAMLVALIGLAVMAFWPRPPKH